MQQHVDDMRCIRMRQSVRFGEIIATKPRQQQVIGLGGRAMLPGGDLTFHMDRNVRENFLPSDWSHDRDAWPKKLLHDPAMAVGANVWKTVPKRVSLQRFYH